MEEDITVISLEKTCDSLNETITTKVHLDKTGGNIINFKRDFENTQFEKEEHGDSGFFLQEKMDEEVAVISQEKFEEDFTVIYQEKLGIGDTPMCNATERCPNCTLFDAISQCHGVRDRADVQKMFRVCVK